MSYHPNIVGFACQWCTYAGADLPETCAPNIRLRSN
jgi:coenzyme F420-reducing hydrogenase delta subunit